MDFNGGMHREHFIYYYRERLGQTIPAAGEGVVYLKCPFCSKEGKLKLNLSTGFWSCPTCQRSGKCYSMETMLSGCSPKDAVAKVHEVVSRVIIEEREKAEREQAEYSKSSASLDFSQSEHIYKDQFGLNVLLVRHATLFDGQVTVEYHAEGNNGQWQQITKGLPQLLYRLPALLSSPSIIITESEPAADDLQNALQLTGGWSATCWPQHFDVWPPSFTNYFWGKKVFLVPENTDASRARLQTAATALVGVAAIVKLALLPGAESVSKFIKQKSAAAAQELLGAFESAPLWAKESPDTGFSAKTVAELMNSDSHEQSGLIEGLLPANGLGLLIGPPKKGKSTLARQAAVAVADGTDFLGRKVKQGKVLYISLEETEANCIAHLKKLGLKNPHNILLRYGSSPTTNQLRNMLKQHSIRLVVLDTLFKCVQVKAVNDYVTVLNALQPILETAHEVGALVLGIHHLNQTGGTLGSTAIEAGTDVNIFFDRDGEKGLIWTAPRYGEALGKTTLAFDKQKQSYSLGKPQLLIRREEMAAEMREFIGHNPGATQPLVFASVEGRTAEKYKAFELVKPDIKRYGTGRSGNPYRYYPKEEDPGKSGVSQSANEILP